MNVKINTKIEKRTRKMTTYGYARISTKKQSIDRQIRNIKEYNAAAVIFEEAYTGTKIEGRKEFNKLLSKVKKGDTIVFDSVSRMSRNADDGIELYFDLYEKGINLVFLKERYIDTEMYKQESNNKIELTGEDVDEILKGINKYFKTLAKKQIRIAFEQAQKEVDDLRERTKEGIREAKAKGKQVGAVEGKKLTTKKSIEKKELIKKYNQDFDGSLNDKDTMELIKISRNTFYKYKREMFEAAAE